MHEGSGSILYDHSRYSRNATAYGGISWSDTEMLGPTLLFDGNDDYLKVSNGHEIMETISASKSISITFWVKNSGAEASEYILSYGWIGPDKTLGVRFTDTGKLRFWAEDSWACQSEEAFDDDSWHFVAAIADSEVSRIYVDGEERAEDEVGSFWSPTTERNLYIGTVYLSGSGLVYHYSGLLCDFRIYNRALNQDEIKALELYYRNFEVRPSILCPHPTL